MISRIPVHTSGKIRCFDSDSVLAQGDIGKKLLILTNNVLTTEAGGVRLLAGGCKVLALLQLTKELLNTFGHSLGVF